jgi:filamentous hemagglutinin
LTGTIIGGVGASKVLGKGVAGVAGEVVGQGKVILVTSESGHGGLKLLSPATTTGAKIESQITARGWTRELLDEAIRNPSRKVATRDTRFTPDGGRIDEPALAYYHKDGGYVVRNERTGDVVQVSNRNDALWITPWDSK